MGRRPNDNQIIDVDKDEVEPAIAIRPTNKKERTETKETKPSSDEHEKIEDSRDDTFKEVTEATSQERESHNSADTTSNVNLTKRPLDIACTEATMPASHDEPTPKHYNFNKNKRSRISEGARSSQKASVPAGDYSSSNSFEARQDKSQANVGEYENRYSSSASITQGLSWTEYPEPAGLNSKSMSWEVPAGTLSTIGSFGQFNMGNKSPQKKMRDSALQGEFAPLPPLPGTEQEDNMKQNHLAPRPIHGMFDPPRPTGGHYAGNGQQESLMSAHDSYPQVPSLPSMSQYVSNSAGSFTMETRDISHASPSRPPYEYADSRAAYPDPSQSVSLFPYPNEQPNPNPAGSFEDGLSANRSFQSLEGLDGPENLMYGKSFSWERGLDMEEGNGQDNHVNDESALVQLKDQQSILRTLAMRGAIRTIGNPHNSVGLILLLSMPEDRHCLSETLSIIRNNVEVFTATEADINAPAPGRKRPIQLGQVGLRCVYCRMCRTGNRVKRATCFPSSMRRIYRAVIDMKLDHFKHCPYVPPGLKQRLEQLSQGTTRSTGMTVQYFIRSAMELGMMDIGNDGVFINLKRVGKVYDDSEIKNYCKPIKAKRAAPQLTTAPKQRNQARGLQAPVPMPSDEKRFQGKVVLALPEDKNFLSPLRCFLREQVCVFSATETDIAIRTPTTFTVQLGQVGVGCVHCLAVAPKERSNRAVCFPFSIGRIYQSVADIQRFHLGECRMMPAEERSRFLQLQSESAKGSRGLATRTYWIDAAKKIGLKDGASGMFFSRDPALPPPVEDKPNDVLAQIATNFNAAKYPLVGPEDKPTIADFLYRVMEQLQPCRFTDADRNKRRSKNLGSIGVECRHCAGKIDGRKFFWSSVSAAESNFVSVHSHMMECRYIDDSLKTELARLKTLRREQTSQLKNGSQKAFFTRVWERLQDIGEKVKAEETMALDAAANAQVNETKKVECSEDDIKELEACGSEDLNALLQNQSTLSSMPSIEHCDSIVKTAIQQLSDEEINMSGSAGDSVVHGGASKSSLSTVARNLSAVTMHCKEETAKIAEV